MRDQVRDSLSRSANGQELRVELARHGITLVVNRGQDGQPRGISFERMSQGENGAESRVAFKGSKLHQQLGISQLQAQLAQNAQQRQKLAAEAAKEQERVRGQKIEKSSEIEEKQVKRGNGRSL